MDSQTHMRGLLRLLDPSEVARAKAQLGSANRSKWLKRLAHNIEMHPQFTFEAARGARSPEQLLAQLRALGAGDTCYVIASDSKLDDSFQSLQDMVMRGSELFGHGTILSCVAGKLALFRTAFPHRHLIVHRPA